MRSCVVRIENGGGKLKVALSDFNRLRWAVAALRSNAALASRLRLTTADDFVRECAAHAVQAQRQLVELG